MAVWYDFYQTSGGAISRTSEWVISHQHEFDKIISQCHPCDYLFIIYHNTRTNKNFVNTYHSHIYYASTHCHFLTLQITVCLSCQTQQAMHNALCDVLCQNNMIQKKINFFSKNKFQKKNSQKKGQQFIFKKKKNISIFFQNQNFTKTKFQHFSPIKFDIVSHSSYHTPTLLPVEYDTGIW